MPLVQIPLGAGLYSSVSDLTSQPSQLVNFETDDAGVLIQRPGLVSYALASFTTSPVIGIEHWNTYLILVTEDRRIWAVADSTPYLARALSSGLSTTKLEGTERPTFAIGQDHVYVAGGGRLQRWSDTLSLSELVADSPNCTHVVAMGQRLVVNDIDSYNRQEFRWSEVGEGNWTVWPALNTSTADSRPDPIVAIGENAAQLYVWGEFTSQVYQVSVDPQIPFDRVASVNTGLFAPYSPVRLDQQFAVFDDKRNFTVGDVVNNQEISRPIKEALRRLPVGDDCFGWREERDGKSLVVWRFPLSGRTFVYDLAREGGWWGERGTYVAPFPGDYPVSAYHYWKAQNLSIVGLDAGGLATMASAAHVDITAPLVSELTTGRTNHGTAQPKRSLCVQVVMRRGTAAQNATPGALELRVQDDQGPWSEWEPISIGAPHDYGSVVRVFFGGVFRTRRYGLRYSNTDPTAIAELWDDVSELVT